jgi:hypothetical protein
MTNGTVSVISWNCPKKRSKNNRYHDQYNAAQASAFYHLRVQKHPNQKNLTQKRLKNQSKRKVNFYPEPMKSSYLSA